MSTRLQIIVSNEEFLRVKRIAAKQGKGVSAWVRGLIQAGLGEKRYEKGKAGLEMLKVLELPAPSIEEMLNEIEQGRA